MTLIISLLFAGYLTFLSGMSVLFVVELEVSKEALPLFQAALLGAWLLGNIAFPSTLKYLGNGKTKRLGAGLSMLGGLILLTATILFPQNPYFLTFGMILYAFGANWIQALYFPEGMELFPEIKGVTSSIITSARLLLTAFVVGEPAIL